jgi:hypothetical protein
MPLAVGQAGVEDRHVRAQRRDAPGRLRGRAGLADHLDVALVLEQFGQAALLSVPTGARAACMWFLDDLGGRAV